MASTLVDDVVGLTFGECLCRKQCTATSVHRRIGALVADERAALPRPRPGLTIRSAPWTFFQRVERGKPRDVLAEHRGCEFRSRGLIALAGLYDRLLGRGDGDAEALHDAGLVSSRVEHTAPGYDPAAKDFVFPASGGA